MTEAQIEQRLGKMVRERGGLYYKFVSPGNDGVPDRIVITQNGKVIFVELKTETGKLSDKQKAQIEKLGNHNADTRIVKGMQSAIEFVKEVFGK